MKFAQLLFGRDVNIENYSRRLPFQSDESFLLFAKGACKEPRPFSCLRNLIVAQFEEIKEYEISRRNNHMNPTKSQQMLSKAGKHVHYYTAVKSQKMLARAEQFLGLMRISL